MESINKQVAEWLNDLEKSDLLDIIRELAESRPVDNHLLEIWERAHKD